jgi:uncharacterized protein (DUF934 family)
MSVIVRDDGFHNDDWALGYVAPSANAVSPGLDLGPDTDLADLPPLDGVQMIRIAFPSFSDGRGFTLARRLRDRGYQGRLRALGHVIADQYAMARRSGFDEVEISADLAARQPEDQWQARANWRDHDYRSRLRA